MFGLFGFRLTDFYSNDKTALMNDKIGNYVWQAAFDVSSVEDRLRLGRAIRDRLPDLAHSNVAQRSVMYNVLDSVLKEALPVDE